MTPTFCAWRLTARFPSENDDMTATLKFKDTLRLRGAIEVAKWRLEDPNDPLQRELALRLGPNDEHGGLWLPDGEGYGENLFLNVGINRLLDLLTGTSALTFTNAEAQIGIGDSSAAAAATQTDLQAASNKTWKAMDATFPPAASSQSTQFKSTFGTADANYVWAEFAVRRATGTLLLDRGVSAMGTKTSAGTWVPTVTISIA
jgi:hypothetical protein